MIALLSCVYFYAKTSIMRSHVTDYSGENLWRYFFLGPVWVVLVAPMQSGQSFANLVRSRAILTLLTPFSVWRKPNCGISTYQLAQASAICFRYLMSGRRWGRDVGETSGLGTDGAIYTLNVFFILLSLFILSFQLILRKYIAIHQGGKKTKKKTKKKTTIKTKERHSNDSAFIYHFLTLYLLCFVSIATKCCLNNTQLYTLLNLQFVILLLLFPQLRPLFYSLTGHHLPPLEKKHKRNLTSWGKK